MRNSPLFNHLFCVHGKDVTILVVNHESIFDLLLILFLTFLISRIFTSLGEVVKS